MLALQPYDADIVARRFPQEMDLPPEIIERVPLHAGWTTLSLVRLKLESGALIDREVEDHGRAVAILPYDPERQTALLVRLLRAPVLLMSGTPELLEVPAGLVEEDDPAETARRELYEETGLQVRRLEHVGCVWTSPGVSTERMDLYLAQYSERDRIGPGGGLNDENENITVVELSLNELWATLHSDQILDMKTLALVLLLHSRHPHLFAATGK
jgi:nudix-type nucleoside diphosphatase (YffH/AdpP family)